MIEISSLNSVSPIELSLNDLSTALQYIEMIQSKMQETKEISLLEYETYKILVERINRFSIEDKLSEKGLLQQKIKKIVEKIQGQIEGKKEYEFISDYFIGETSHVSNGDNDEILNTNMLTNRKPDIFEDFSFTNCPIKVTDKKFLADVLPLTSVAFLKEKLGLDSEEIINIKGKIAPDEQKLKQIIADSDTHKPSNVDTSEHSLIKKKASHTFMRCSKDFLIAKKKNNTQEPSKGVEEINKEIDEGINEEIFRYTKNMKEYAKSFNYALQKDIVTLDSIEKIQNVDKVKTDKEVKRLKEFNYSLTIGFCKLILMMIIVFVSFITTLLTIRIFPKLV